MGMDVVRNLKKSFLFVKKMLFFCETYLFRGNSTPKGGFAVVRAGGASPSPTHIYGGERADLGVRGKMGDTMSGGREIES